MELESGHYDLLWKERASRSFGRKAKMASSRRGEGPHAHSFRFVRFHSPVLKPNGAIPAPLHRPRSPSITSKYIERPLFYSKRPKKALLKQFEAAGRGIIQPSIERVRRATRLPLSRSDMVSLPLRSPILSSLSTPCSEKPHEPSRPAFGWRACQNHSTSQSWVW